MLLTKLIKMIPEEFINRIHTQKYIDAEALLKSLEEPSPVSIRINPFKVEKETIQIQNQFPGAETGIILATRPSYTLDPLFHSGCYYPQEASGMFLEQIIKQTSDFSENYPGTGSVWSSRREKYSSFRSYRS